MVFAVKKAAYTIEQVKRELSPLVLTRFKRDEHYDTYHSWWKDREQKAPTEAMLADIGLLVMDKKEMVAATFCYITNSTIGHIGFTAAKPNAGPKRRIMALMFLLRQADEVLKAAGCNAVHTFSSEPGLTKLFQRMGYVEQQKHSFLLKHFGGEINGT